MYFAAVLIITLTQSTRSDSSCRSVSSIGDYTLQGHVYRTIQDKDVTTCIIACDNDQHCFSINFIFTTRVCELSDSTRVTYPNDFVNLDDAIYFEHLYRPSGSCFDHKEPCTNGATCVNIPQSPGYKCFCRKDYTGQTCQECSSPAIGVSDGRIPDSQISASSEGMWFPVKIYRPYFARLNGPSSWVPGVLDLSPFLQVNLAPRARLITRVATQASPEHDWWTTSYVIQYSMNDKKWKEYEVDGFTEVFLGNNDRNTAITHNISEPFIAIFVRFYPLTKLFRSALRVELYGCDA